MEKADLFISVMPAETENLLACMLASKLGVEQTMARVDSARYLSTEYMPLLSGWESALLSILRSLLLKRLIRSSKTHGRDNILNSLEGVSWS